MEMMDPEKKTLEVDKKTKPEVKPKQSGSASKTE
jgi:hypothetical protein